MITTETSTKHSNKTYRDQHMKTIVLGIGNLILRDDGVGIHVANELKKHIDDPSITIDEAITGGMMP